MRFVIISILLLKWVSCPAQRNIVSEEIIATWNDNNNKKTHNIFTDIEPGGCYFSVKVPQHETDKISRYRLEVTQIDCPYIIEVVPAQYKEIEVMYASKDLKSIQTADGSVYLTIRKAHATFRMWNSKISEYTHFPDPIGYMYCLVEIPSEVSIFNKNQLRADSIMVCERKIVSESVVLKKYVKRKPKKLKSNQLYFEEGTWTIPKRAIGSSCGVGHRVKDVQKRLNEIGYSLEKNNIMNEETKEALLDFQKKNDLRKGQLDYETLKKLGMFNKD